MSSEFKREKNWKHLYLRSVKLARAKQLGLEYPVQTEAQLAVEAAQESHERLNVLFVCSRNQWALCRSVWNLTSHPMPGDAGREGRGGHERRGRQVGEFA